MSLGRVLLRRLALSVFLLFGISFMTFFISHAVPGDPVATMLGERGTDEQIARMRTQLGLDQPLPIQYARYLVGLAHLDLGQSIRTKRPVTEDLKQYFPATIELASAALLLAILVGIPLGVASALAQNRWPDHAARVFALAGVSTPVFWLGLLLLYLFYSRWDLLPAVGRISDFVDPPTPRTGLFVIDSILSGNGAALWSTLRHLVLPACCLGYSAMATLSRMVRSQMLDVLSQDYVRTARATGLRRATTVFKYALKNALIPTITIIGLAYGGLLSGAVLTETIFSWPGIGKYAVGSMVNLDFPALMGVTLLIAVTYSLVNLLVDLLYLVLDPRIRMEGGDPVIVRRLLSNRLSLIGILLIGLLLGLGLMAPFVAPFDPNAQQLDKQLMAPNGTHLFGTDSLGRDIFSRVLHGALYSIPVGFAVVFVATVLGLIIGSLSGFFGGWVDDVLMRVTDLFLAFPALILAMAIAGALGPSLPHALMALSLSWWPPYARLVRSQVLALRESAFVEAARCIGASRRRILLRHILPNCLSPVVIQGTLDLGGVILTAAGLSFIGLGAQPPQPEWGAMVNFGRLYIASHWWVATFPGLAILTAVMGFNLFGDGLRDVLDPRMRKEVAP